MLEPVKVTETPAADGGLGTVVSAAVEHEFAAFNMYVLLATTS